MNNKNIKFIYRDSRGNITAREVGNISETEDYIQGICLKANSLRTFRKDRILEELSDFRNAGERIEYFIENNPPVSQKSSSSRRSNNGSNPEVCFTGFKKNEKDELNKLAESSGMFVRSSVTCNLDFLCCGSNAGPKKIEKSRHQGVVVLNSSQFKFMLETGEIPDEA